MTTTFQKYSGPTRAEAQKQGEALGLEGPALELFVADGAQQRHAARVQYVLAASKAWVEECVDVVPGNTENNPRLRALQACLIHLELGGVGGPQGLGGDGTARASWAEGMGKGRKQATDGGAWEAALEGALTQLGGFEWALGDAPSEELFGWVGEVGDLPRWSIDVADLIENLAKDRVILLQARGALGREIRKHVQNLTWRGEEGRRLLKAAGVAFNTVCEALKAAAEASKKSTETQQTEAA